VGKAKLIVGRNGKAGRWRTNQNLIKGPMNRGSLGIPELNVRLRHKLNPARADEPAVEEFGWQFRPGTR
jgi:ATP-dependent exoDNAse (exonuclease V) alpha subunit